MREALERLEARHLASRSSRRDTKRSEQKIGRRQRGQRAEDHGRGEPIERHLVEVVPDPPGGLNEDARARIELVDVSLDARSFAKQCLFVDDARVGIDQRRLRNGWRAEGNEAAKPPARRAANVAAPPVPSCRMLLRADPSPSGSRATAASLKSGSRAGDARGSDCRDLWILRFLP